MWWWYVLVCILVKERNSYCGICVHTFCNAYLVWLTADAKTYSYKHYSLKNVRFGMRSGRNKPEQYVVAKCLSWWDIGFHLKEKEKLFSGTTCTDTNMYATSTFTMSVEKKGWADKVVIFLITNELIVCVWVSSQAQLTSSSRFFSFSFFCPSTHVSTFFGVKRDFPSVYLLLWTYICIYYFYVLSTSTLPYHHRNILYLWINTDFFCSQLQCYYTFVLTHWLTSFQHCGELAHSYKEKTLLLIILVWMYTQHKKTSFTKKSSPVIVQQKCNNVWMNEH